MQFVTAWSSPELLIEEGSCAWLPSLKYSEILRAVSQTLFSAESC